MKNLESIQRAFDRGDISEIEYRKHIRKFVSTKIMELDDILTDLVSIDIISSEMKDYILSLFD